MFAVSVLEKSLTLPCVEKMLEDQESDYRKRVASVRFGKIVVMLMA